MDASSSPLLLLPLLLSLLFVSVISSQSCSNSNDPLVRCTSEGLIRGKLLYPSIYRSTGVYTFLGIPYGEAPIGEQRFRRSKRKRPWSRAIIYNATDYAATCYQMLIDTLNATGEKIWTPTTTMSEDCLYLNVWTPTTTMSEDCLYLNVWTPTASRLTGLAVMVWIYGGGFTSGSSTLKVYDGSILAARQNVIVVSIEYRVESLGFLYLGTSDAPGNQGLHDQQLALQWIQTNIQAFGGDPHRVTLFGESAGAVSVGLHLLSPPSRGLYQNAILQSSGPTAKWAVLTPEIAKFRTEKFLHVLTKHITERASSDLPLQCQKTLTTIEEKFQCVKHYPIRNLEHFRHLWAIESYNGDPVGYTFVPTIDSDLIPYDPEQMLLHGDFKRTSILLGVNQDEGSYFNIYLPHGNLTYHSSPSIDHPTFQSVMKEYFRHFPTYPRKAPSIILDSILQTYTLWHDVNNTFQNAVQLNYAVGDYHFTCPTIFLADIYAKDRLPVYFYYFTVRSSVSPWHPWMGVLHADELMFVFGEPLNISDDLHYTEEEVVLSEKMMNYWANFAKYGNPNQIDDHQWANEWRQYRWPHREYLHLNLSLIQTLFPEHGSTLRANFCAFWLDYIPKLMLITGELTDAERRWKEEFHQYEDRIQQWDYHYTKYLQNMEKMRDCLG